MPMSAVSDFLARNPISLSAAVHAVLNFVVIMGWVSMTDTQVAAANIALASVLALFVKSATTNTRQLSDIATTSEVVPPHDGGDLGPSGALEQLRGIAQLAQSNPEVAGFLKTFAHVSPNEAAKIRALVTRETPPPPDGPPPLPPAPG